MLVCSPANGAASRPPRTAELRELGQLGLLHRRQRVLDTYQEPDLRPLHLTFSRQDTIHLLQYLRLVRGGALQ